MEAVTLYHALATLIETGIGSDKLAHVHAGLALYVGTQYVLRDRRASWRALQVVITLAILNEAMDRLFWGGWRLHDTIGDLVATIAWPAILYTLGRVRRARWRETCQAPRWRRRVRPREVVLSRRPRETRVDVARPVMALERPR